MPGSNDTFEQLKAAKAYLASKIQDAQHRMQADPPLVSGNLEEGQLTTFGVVGDTAPSRTNAISMTGDVLPTVVAPTILEPLPELSSGDSFVDSMAQEAPTGSSYGGVVTGTQASTGSSCGTDVTASTATSMVFQDLMALRNRPIGQSFPIPEVCSPSLSVSAEGSAYNGTGSFAGQTSMGSAVIVEDVELLEPRLGGSHADGDELGSRRGSEAPTYSVAKGKQSNNSPDEYEVWKANLMVNANSTLSGATEASTGTSSARLAWTRAELHACRDELNSAVYEAVELRRSEEISAEAAASVAMNPEATVQRIDSGAEREVHLRVLELESRNAELTSENQAMSTRAATLEQRVRELEDELKARPFAPDSEFEMRMVEKTNQIERLRLHADEATKELELRQEMIDGMEARLRQAERASQFPAVGTTVHVPAKVVDRPDQGSTSSVMISNQARLDAAQMELQRLNQATSSQLGSSRLSAPNGVSSLDDARARVKLLYEQMSTQDAQTETLSNGDVRRGRTLRSTVAALGSREPSASRVSVYRSRSPSQPPVVAAREIGVPYDAPKNGVRGPRVQLVNALGEAKRLDTQVSGMSSLTGSATQASSPMLTPGSSPQSLGFGGMSVDGRSNVSVPEAQLLRQNVSELEMLMTQMAGEKARTTNSLEHKIVELESLVGQANKKVSANSSTLSDGIYRLVGSHGSSTRTSSPLPAARTIEVARASSPVPSPTTRHPQQARLLSPTPSTGGPRYYLSPQSGSTSMQQLSSPTQAQAPRRSTSRTPNQSRVYPQSSTVTNYAAQQGASASPPQQTATVLPVSRSPSPTVVRAGQSFRDTPTPMNMASWLGRAG